MDDAAIPRLSGMEIARPYRDLVNWSKDQLLRRRENLARRNCFDNLGPLD